MPQANDPQALYKRAMVFHQNGRLSDAEQIYQQLIAALPLSAEPRQMLGLIRLQQGRNSEALDLFSAVLKIDPGNAGAHANYGNAMKGLGRLEEALAAYDKALAISPDFVSLLYNRALLLQELNRSEAALGGYERVLAQQPHFVEALYNRGILLMGLGRDQEALTSLDQALMHRPAFAEAWNNRGIVLCKLARNDEALASFNKAVELRPEYTNAILNRGDLLLTEFRHVENALADYEKVLALKPNLVEAWNSYGNALCELGRFDESRASFKRARVINPDFPPTHYNNAVLLQKTNHFSEALASYDRALALKPDFTEALFNRSILLLAMQRNVEALASIDSALSQRPGSAESWNTRGTALHRLQRHDEAMASFDRALTIKPRFARALYNLGSSLGDMNHFEAALASYDRALAIEPLFAEALNNRGVALEGLSRFEEALDSYERALAIDPNQPYALSGAATAALNLCDWQRAERFGQELKAHIATFVIQPMTFLGYSDDAALQMQCAKRWTQDKIPVALRPSWNGTAYRHGKIRIAYVSTDFKRHPVAYSLADLFEHHDRSRFEVIGISLGLDNGSEIRKRVVHAFDEFHDVHCKDSLAIAELIKSREVDIAVDLNGHTQGGRLEIFAHRAAPVQVNYLGYPGTTGADFIDYIVADKVVLPFEQRRFFTEKIVHLPDSFFPGYSRGPITQEVPARHEAGLPECGFVFCCFNNSWKITAPVFDIWMRLLASVPDSVLWLRAARPSVQERLRREATARGIDPQRLVFAPDVELAMHFARHQLADLFLDTLPYNAHATASDALWAGLPLVTCEGQSFAGRVGASLLCAAGLPELVTQSLDDYEALALRLAHDAELLKSFRLRLDQNRLTSPLFDADRFRRNIEAAYTRMWTIAEHGEPVQCFSVESG